MTDIRYGLIGSGMMGQEHIRNIALLDGAHVSAVCDPDAAMRELSAQSSGGKGFASLDDMLSADLCDVFLIVSPNDTHADVLRKIMATDKPILCEKPLSTTTSDCRDILNLAQTRRAPIWVAMEYRYMPPVQRLLQAVRDDVPGQARMMAIREHRFPFLDKVGDWNRFNQRTGGTLTEKCCHFWDLMRLVLQSDPVRVFASAAADVNHQDESYGGAVPDIIDNAFVVVDFENGARGMLDLCMFAEGSYWQETIAVTGAKARVEAFVPGPARFSIDGQERSSEVVTSLRETKEIIREEVHVDEAILAAGDHHGSTFFQHQRFLELVRSGQGQPEVTLEDGFWSVLVGEAAQQSAQSGEAVDLRGKGP
jgi:predicted dehydrogenase